TQHILGARPPGQRRKEQADPDPFVRAWSIQLDAADASVEKGLLDHEIAEFAKLAESDPSPVVRLYVASACQRLPLKDRWVILENLVAHAEDSSDHNLPLMYWYAAEPLGGAEPKRALELAFKAKTPYMLPFMVRRVGSNGTPESLELLVARINETRSDEVRSIILRGMQEALKGRRNVPMPKSWPSVFTQLIRNPAPEVHGQALTVAVTFGDPEALRQLRQIVLAVKQDVGLRRQALGALIDAHDNELVPILHAMLAEKALRGQAIRGL